LYILPFHIPWQVVLLQSYLSGPDVFTRTKPITGKYISYCWAKTSGTQTINGSEELTSGQLKEILIARQAMNM